MLRSQSKLTEDGCSLIGWKEWLALPDLGIPALKAKIDTGARTSALHTFCIEEFTVKEQLMVRFGIHPLRKQNNIELFCKAPVFDRRLVKDSGGHSEMRYVIETMVILGSVQWPIQISLTNREGMMFRMLLGRTALKQRFLVDPGQAYLTGRALAKSYSLSKSRSQRL